jgi:hypothetical protein
MSATQSEWRPPSEWCPPQQSCLPGIPRIAEEDGAALSYADFYRRYLRPNEPVLLRGACSSWPAMHTMRSASDGGLDVDYLSRVYGGATVPVVVTARRASGSDAAGDSYGGGERHQQSLAAFLASLPASADPAATTTSYAKDFHFHRAFPGQPDYAVPLAVADDWLNWWYDATADPDDYRFLYLGPSGSATPLHHDVLYSASWSANVTGWKLWVLLPPDEAARTLYDGRGNLTAQTLLSAPERAAVDELLFAGGSLAAAATGASPPSPPPLPPAADSGAERRRLCLQGPGDLMFVPSGWHHHVVNVGTAPVLSINHNWFSGPCLPHVAAFLLRELRAVRAAIADERAGMGDADWHAHCQLLLRANCGFNLDGLGALVACKAAALLRQQELQVRHGGGGEAAVAPTAVDDAAAAAPGSAARMLPVADAPHVRLPDWVIADALSSVGAVLRELVADAHYTDAGQAPPAWRLVTVGGEAPGDAVDLAALLRALPAVPA